jgi:hypothetical protein
MYEITTPTGDCEYFETFAKIGEYFNECVWAEGADDAEIRIRLVDRDSVLK